MKTCADPLTLLPSPEIAPKDALAARFGRVKAKLRRPNRPQSVPPRPQPPLTPAMSTRPDEIKFPISCVIASPG